MACFVNERCFVLKLSSLGSCPCLCFHLFMVLMCKEASDPAVSACNDGVLAVKLWLDKSYYLYFVSMFLNPHIWRSGSNLLQQNVNIH